MPETKGESIFYSSYCLDHGIYHDALQYSSGGRRILKSYVSDCIERDVDRIYHYFYLPILCQDTLQFLPSVLYSQGTVQL